MQALTRQLLLRHPATAWFFFAKMQIVGREVAHLGKVIPLMNGDCLSFPMDEALATKLLDNPVGVHGRNADGIRNVANINF